MYASVYFYYCFIYMVFHTSINIFNDVYMYRNNLKSNAFSLIFNVNFVSNVSTMLQNLQIWRTSRSGDAKDF